MTIQNFLAPITGRSAAVSLPDAETWMQGRTLYGGASALVAYTQATRAFPDLPPLRAAQIGFVAPLGGDIELRAEIARQGRSVTHTQRNPPRWKTRSDSVLSVRRTARAECNVYGREANDFPAPPSENDDAISHKGPVFLRSDFEIRRGSGHAWAWRASGAALGSSKRSQRS